jgi:hypothetical protein
VVINGQHFLGVIGVQFNGVPAATFAIDSDQRITAIVPDKAGSGPVTVQSPGGTGASLVSFSMLSVPDNDQFANARILPREAGSDVGTNRGARREPGEPNHGGMQGGRSVWYEWTASDSSVWSFDTVGSDFDTVLAVYVGGAVSTLEPVTFNDDALGGTNSVVVFQALGGTSYRLVVDGFNEDPNQPESSPSRPRTMRSQQRRRCQVPPGQSTPATSVRPKSRMSPTMPGAGVAVRFGINGRRRERVCGRSTRWAASWTRFWRCMWERALVRSHRSAPTITSIRRAAPAASRLPHRQISRIESSWMGMAG